MDKKRILIVEDSSDARELLVLLLSRSGYDTVEAATGLEAVDKARDEHPDLILMDLGLPGITGDEATARIKADRSTSDIPVIVNTAFNKGTSLVIRAIAAGAAEIVQKPVNFKSLQELVQRYLSPTYQRVDVSTETVNDSDWPAAALV
jgi:CheY-like chemotaxis protein